MSRVLNLGNNMTVKRSRQLKHIHTTPVQAMTAAALADKNSRENISNTLNIYNRQYQRKINKT